MNLVVTFCNFANDPENFIYFEDFNVAPSALDKFCLFMIEWIWILAGKPTVCFGLYGFRQSLQVCTGILNCCTARNDNLSELYYRAL